MSPNYIDSLLVQTEDTTLDSDDITYDSPKSAGPIKGLLLQPKDTQTKLPGVIVAHENRGLNPYIEAVDRRTTKDGFSSLALDALPHLVAIQAISIKDVPYKKSATNNKCSKLLSQLSTILKITKIVIVMSAWFAFSLAAGFLI